MFKQASCANEVAEAMMANLEHNRLEIGSSFNKLASAINVLAADADSSGYADESERLTSLLEQFAKTAQSQGDFSLDPKDRAFFDMLEPHHKERLKKHDVKHFAEEVKKLRMAKEVADELAGRNKELGEFQSLLPRGKQLPESSIPQDVIEMEPYGEEDQELAHAVEQSFQEGKKHHYQLQQDMAAERGDANDASSVSLHSAVVSASVVVAAFDELRAAAKKKAPPPF